MQRLETYAGLLVKWQAKINLVGPATLPDLWRRHFLDSAQLLPLLPAAAGTLADLGSGAGFPGLVLAIMTDWRVHLLDSDQRKCAFLRQVALDCGVLDRVTIHAKRIEQVTGIAADVVTARACAPLGELLGSGRAVHRRKGHRSVPEGRAGGRGIDPGAAALDNATRQAGQHFRSRGETS